MALIEVQNVSKEYRITKREEGAKGMLKHLFRPEYGAKKAVDHISFSIEKGESVAFLGANGAGKSTTIKMLTGIMKPTAGQIRIMGVDPFQSRIENAKHIGVVFGQKTQLWWDIPIIETFRLLKDMYEIPADMYCENMEKFQEILGLGEFMDQPARKLSLGQRVRADLAAALLHEPPVLFLDEPTIGLDVAVKQRVYEFLRYVNQEKKTTILLTSHDLKDLETICGKLMILERGKIIFNDDMKEIFHLYGGNMTLEEIVIKLYQQEAGE